MGSDQSLSCRLGRWSLNRNTLLRTLNIDFDCLVNIGAIMARISTYMAANGCKIARSPPSRPRLAIIIENSPRATTVNPMFAEASGDRAAVRPASMPAVKFPNSVTTTAASASQTAVPPSERGSMDSPKLKKNTAPKKSRNGIMRCSIRLACSVSASTSPTSNAPIASAT